MGTVARINRAFYPIGGREWASPARGTPSGAEWSRRRPRHGPAFHRRPASPETAATRARATAAMRCTTARFPSRTTSLLERDDRSSAVRSGQLQQLARAPAGTRDSRAGRRLRSRGRTSRRPARPSSRRAAREMREQRPVQVVDDDDRVEALARERPCAGLRDRARGSRRRRRCASAASASASRSTATTCAPRAARKREWRPCPAARSSTRAPAATSCAKRAIHGDGVAMRVHRILVARRQVVACRRCARCGLCDGVSRACAATACVQSPRAVLAPRLAASHATNAATSGRATACGATSA